MNDKEQERLDGFEDMVVSKAHVGNINDLPQGNAANGRRKEKSVRANMPDMLIGKARIGNIDELPHRSAVNGVEQPGVNEWVIKPTYRSEKGGGGKEKANNPMSVSWVLADGEKTDSRHSSLIGNMADKPDAYTIAAMFTEKTPVILYYDRLFYYDPVTAYHSCSDKNLQRKIRQELPASIASQVNRSTLAEAVEFIRTRFAREITPQDRDAAKRFIRFKDCILDVETDEIIEPTPQIPIMSSIDMDYRRSSKSNGAWKKLLHQIVGTDKSYERVFLEALGYILSAYDFHKGAFLFIGVPNSGKTTLCNLLATAIGEKRCMTMSLSAIGQRFSDGDIFGKHLLQSTEVSAIHPGDMASFKALIGHELLRGEVKFMDAFVFRFEGKYLISGNCPPCIKGGDLDQAVINRRYSCYGCRCTEGITAIAGKRAKVQCMRGD